jgi:hypothetical protein
MEQAARLFFLIVEKTEAPAALSGDLLSLGNIFIQGLAVVAETGPSLFDVVEGVGFGVANRRAAVKTAF